MHIGRVGGGTFFGDGSTAAREVTDVPAIEARLQRAAQRAPVPGAEARLDVAPETPSARVAGTALRRYRRVAVGLAVSDAICVTVALLGSYALRYPGELATAREAAVIALAPLVWIVVFYTFNLYAPQHLSAHEELRRVIGASGVGIVVLVMVSYWSQSPFSRAWVGLTWILVLVLELLPRRWWRAYQWRMRMDGRLALRTLVVGTSAEASRLVENLQVDASGFLPLGHVQVSGPTVNANRLPIMGRIGDLDMLVRTHAADCLFVASTGITEADMARVRQVAREARIEVRVLPNLPQMLTSRLALLSVGSATVVALRSVHLSGPQAAIKRLTDIAVASVALLLSLPLWPMIALAIRLDSPGPVLFHQERVTKDGRIFPMHKFRTMRTGDPGFDTTRPFFKLESDPRLTRVGAFLRRLSLDELPQLWNVLTGEMSIVGPRPLPADQVAANPELLTPRHAVPAGVTGWWQINGRSGVTPEEALRLDLFYIENWSPTLDLFILLKTFGALAKREGAY
jgi:exopolysaccharide biosynthesis polyprenyl glycosylphosphotransferase